MHSYDNPFRSSSFRCFYVSLHPIQLCLAEVSKFIGILICIQDYKVSIAVIIGIISSCFCGGARCFLNIVVLIEGICLILMIPCYWHDCRVK
ncbi:hypothetical protein D3C76_1239160 [compost metagenome]